MIAMFSTSCATMACRMQRASLLLVVGALSAFLHGCDSGTEVKNCDGEGCACTLTFHSFWARIQISGVHIEHASRIFYIPDVAKDVPNATGSPCCDAIFDQIDYDEGKSSSMPSRTVDTFRSSCASSPNPDIASAATRQSFSLDKSGHSAGRSKRQLGEIESQPIDDGQVGQDCYVGSEHGFRLNGELITSGSMKLRIRWVDPQDSETKCCNAMRPLLTSMYINGTLEPDLPSKVKSDFCDSCTGSNNQGVALAAFRCFGTRAGSDLLV